MRSKGIGIYMKKVSKRYHYDEQYFAGKVPSEAMKVSSSQDEEYPIYISDDFISTDECVEIIEQFTREGVAGKAEASGDVKGVRKAFNFTLGGRAKEIYATAFQRSRPQIEKFFSTQFKDSVGAHGLGYSPGCKYDVHADNCDAVVDAAGQLQEFKLVNERRQLSSILFLTESVDEFTSANQHVGGNLSFRFIHDNDDDMLLVEPKPGLFVAFPSSPIFCHEVHEVYDVSSDFRITIVDWYDCEQTNS